jgi:DNA-directed RNA polymerase beta subunit
MNFDIRQKELKLQDEMFSKWCKEYGYTGLAREYYYRRFEEGFSKSSKDSIEYKKLKELLPHFHEDGYIVNSNRQRINVSRVLSRDYHKILKTEKKGGEIIVYGPFGLIGAIRDKINAWDKRITIKQNDERFTPMDLYNFSFLYKITPNDIEDWIEDKNNSLERTIFLTEIEGEKPSNSTRSNNYLIKNILSNPEIPSTLCKRYSIDIQSFIRNNISYFIYNCLLAVTSEKDDRDHIKNKIVKQKLFFLKKNMNFEKKKEIIENFIDRVNSMEDNEYNNTSCRNKLDMWSSCRKIFMSDREYTPFPVRTIHYSFKKFFCPFETSDGMNSGLTTSLSCFTVIAPGSFIEDSFPIIQSGKKRNFFFNGYYIKKIRFNKENINRFTERIKRIDKYASIYLDRDDLFVSSYPGRIMRWNGKRFICPNMVEDDNVNESMYLGFSASLIPFIHHNSGPRGIFMSNMLKQVLTPDDSLDRSWFRNDNLKILTITSNALMSKRTGMNLLVKWAIHMGYNIEDGIVITKKFMEDTKKSGSRKYIFKMEVLEDKGETLIFVSPKDEAIDSEKYDDNGVIKRGFLVNNGEVLASKLLRDGDTYKKIFLKASVDSECTVEDSKVERVNDKILKVTVDLRYFFGLQIGDKMVSNSSQKGVISCITDDEDENVDIIVNPCCIPSRMTLGQIYEGIITNKMIENKIEKLYFPPFEDTHGFLDYINALEGKKYKNLLDIIPSGGYWKCYNRYYVLGHRVEEKIRAVGKSSKISRITGQVIKGRKNEGGLRIGIMEKDAILAHGGYNILNDMFNEHSDGITIKDGEKDIKITRAAINMQYLLNAMGYSINF